MNQWNFDPRFLLGLMSGCVWRYTESTFQVGWKRKKKGTTVCCGRVPFAQCSLLTFRPPLPLPPLNRLDFIASSCLSWTRKPSLHLLIRILFWNLHLLVALVNPPFKNILNNRFLHKENRWNNHITLIMHEEMRYAIISPKELRP